MLPEFNQLAHGIPAEFMIQEEADGVTLMELLQRYDVRSVDLLQIDVEGYEHEVLRGARKLMASGHVAAVVNPPSNKKATFRTAEVVAGVSAGSEAML